MDAIMQRWLVKVGINVADEGGRFWQESVRTSFDIVFDGSIVGVKIHRGCIKPQFADVLFAILANRWIRQALATQLVAKPDVGYSYIAEFTEFRMQMMKYDKKNIEPDICIFAVDHHNLQISLPILCLTIEDLAGLVQKLPAIEEMNRPYTYGWVARLLSSVGCYNDKGVLKDRRYFRRLVDGRVIPSIVIQ